MTNPYIGQDILDQAAEALRQGKTLDFVAGRLHCSQSHLASLLGLPALQPVSTDDQDQDFDLWAFDDSKEVL